MAFIAHPVNRRANVHMVDLRVPPVSGSSRAAGLLLLVVAASLAGCTGDEDGAPGTDSVQLGDGTTLQLADADDATTTSTGAISGVVVDDAVRPLADVSLRVLGLTQRNLTSDAQGLFLVGELEPGLYTVHANRTGFMPVQTTAEVRAGEVAKVRVQMPSDTSPQPRHVTLQYDGFIQAGNGLANQAWELFVNGTAGVPANSCDCQFYFQTEQEASTFIIEVTWEQSVANPTGDNSGYWAVWDDGEADGGYLDESCANPCYGVASVDGFALPETRNFHTDIWLDASWVQVNQRFTQYVTIFYNGDAPEGWSFVAGDR
jgi:hypothetical protein